LILPFSAEYFIHAHICKIIVLFLCINCDSRIDFPFRTWIVKRIQYKISGTRVLSVMERIENKTITMKKDEKAQTKYCCNV
jgi:hypothetical protein